VTRRTRRTGGAAAAYWQPLAERYGIDITVVNPKIDLVRVCLQEGVCSWEGGESE